MKREGKKTLGIWLSFGSRSCFDEKMVEQRLDYIHHKPVMGVRRWLRTMWSMRISSAAYYELGLKNGYVTPVKK